MQIKLDLSTVSKINEALAGRKAYITLVIGMVVIAVNHFQLLPESLVPDGLDPKNWLMDEYKLVVATFFRAGIAKAGSNA